jgi:hypothetical protein
MEVQPRELSVYPRSTIRRLRRATVAGASSDVKAPADEGLCEPSGRSIKRMLQPRNSPPQNSVSGERAEAEPFEIGRRPQTAAKQQTRATAKIRRGTGNGTKGKLYGTNWGSSRQPAPTWPSGKDLAYNRKAGSRKEGPRVSDEAIVSIDLAGQHNRPGSQGPLDRNVCGRQGSTGQLAARPENPPVIRCGTCATTTLAAYKRRRLADAGHLLNPSGDARRSRPKIRFEAVLGKTRRTEF